MRLSVRARRVWLRREHADPLAEADWTTAWLGSTRITPRSRARSPIERELLG